MGYQPCAYTIVKRNKYYYVQSGGLERGPYEFLMSARRALKKMIHEKEDYVVEKYDSYGNIILNE